MADIYPAPWQWELGLFMCFVCGCRISEAKPSTLPANCTPTTGQRVQAARERITRSDSTVSQMEGQQTISRSREAKSRKKCKVVKGQRRLARKKIRPPYANIDSLPGATNGFDSRQIERWRSRSARKGLYWSLWRNSTAKLAHRKENVWICIQEYINRNACGQPFFPHSSEPLL